MKWLNGRDLAEFIQERQAKQVRGLRQASRVVPRLAIIQCKDDPAINTYIRLKKQYGQEIMVEVDAHKVNQAEAGNLIIRLNNDASVHGIIVQLPLANVSQTDELLNLVVPEKDVDALGESPLYDPATPTAIMWLLAGYNVQLAGKHILVVGQGKLVGAPLTWMLQQSGLDPSIADKSTTDLPAEVAKADIIITATGVPGLITPTDIKEKAVVVDAGVAGEQGKTVGDLDKSVYERDDLTITPQKGGVGPLTVCALFENVILAASRR